MSKNKQLTALAVAALGLLAERPMHPYEMYQVLMQRHEDRLVKIRPGTLYHTVGRLAVAGLVQVVGTERDGNRPERTSYEITPPGRSALETRIMDLLATPVNEYPSFPQALGEAHNLPADVVLELLGTRLDARAAELASLQADAALAKSRTVEPKYLIDLGYQQALLQAEIQWVETLRREISSGAMPW